MSPEPKNVTNYPAVSSIPQLREVIRGHVVMPDNAEYDKARTVFYGGIDRRPAAIVRVASANDVAQVISLARETGLELAVRRGGPNVRRQRLTDGRILIRPVRMRAPQI